MLITFELHELKEILADVARVAVAEYRKELCPADDLICQREAYDQFLEVRVKRWRAEGLVQARRNGPARNSKIMFSRTELLQVEAAEWLRPIMNRKGREGSPSFIFPPRSQKEL